jgi:hypothetical protein
MRFWFRLLLHVKQIDVILERHGRTKRIECMRKMTMHPSQAFAQGKPMMV